MDRSPIAVATIIENEDKVLLIKDAQGSAHGKWNQPAGRLEAGETIEQGAIREAKEETGYSIALTGLVGIYDEMDQEKPRVRFVFTGRLANTEQDKFSEEISEVVWFDKEKIKQLSSEQFASTSTHESLQDYLTGKNYSLEIIK